MTTQDQARKQEDTFRTNMSRMTGFVQGTLKELSNPMYGRRESPEWMGEKLMWLNEVVEYVWANRYERVVDFDEYSNPSLRIPLEK